MGIRGIVFCAGLLAIVPLSGQKKSEITAIWREAESHYLYREYELANPLYLILNEIKPGNANIKYKIGNCYLNIFDEKPKAIPFLEAAVRNTSYDSKTGLLKEKRAPLDAYFSLANAYLITNHLDSALNTYRLFKNLVSEAGEMANQEFINQQIQACNLAVVQMQTPVDVLITPLKEYINQGSVNDRPVISYDGSTMAYTERRGLESVVYVTRKEGDSWGTPVNITAEAKMGTDCYTTSLNSDGTELYLFKNDNYDGNIYMTAYKNGKWSAIVSLNKNINTKYYESHAAISSDGKKLYFTSNRLGGLGELDMWVSERDQAGDWGIPVNLGSVVNTPYNEETPFISQDGFTLTFSSEGHGSIGGYDIFRSASAAGVWGNPVNIGYPISTTDDDLGFQPFDNGKFGYYSLLTAYKKKEIALVVFNAPSREPRDTVTISFDPKDLPYITLTDSSSLIMNLIIKDVRDTDEEVDPEVLYYTVQVMALYNPVDPTYFQYADIAVFYNRQDKFYRYVTGRYELEVESLRGSEQIAQAGISERYLCQESLQR